MSPVKVTRSPHEKAMQRALIQYRKPENYELVKEALIRCNRQDLIGFDKSKCLIPPRNIDSSPVKKHSSSGAKSGQKVVKSGKKVHNNTGFTKKNSVKSKKNR